MQEDQACTCLRELGAMHELSRRRDALRNRCVPRRTLDVPNHTPVFTAIIMREQMDGEPEAECMETCMQRSRRSSLPRRIMYCTCGTNALQDLV